MVREELCEENMKKKITFLIISVLSAFLICSCGLIEKPLKVYVVETDALFRESVNAFQEDNSSVKLKVVSFDTYADMKAQMSTELMSGKGPDVLLFNGIMNTDDTFKMASSGTLLSLDDKIASLDENKYITSVLEAGRVNGQQYLLPFSWNVLQAYSTQGTMNERGYGEDLVAAYKAEAVALENDDTMAVSSTSFGRANSRTDSFNYIMEYAGMELINWETGELNEDKEMVQRAADFFDVIYDSTDKIRTISKRYASDFEGAVSHFTYLLEDFSFMNNLRYYQSVYPRTVNEEMHFNAYSNLDGGVNAMVVEYGAINANTEHADQAWELLCYILDYTGNMDFSKYDEEVAYYAPVNKDVYATYVQELANEQSHGPGYKVDPLQESWVKILEDMPDRLDKAFIPNPALGNLVQECIVPYMAGEDTFDHSYEQLMQKMTMYIQE